MRYQLRYVRVPPAGPACVQNFSRSRPSFKLTWAHRYYRLTGHEVAAAIEALSQIASRRRFAGACLDWTQRRPHLGGALAAAITARLFELGWIERGPLLRAVRVTPEGREGLAATFGWADG
jgi:hypothetical protein